MLKVIAFDLDDTLFNATLLANNARYGGIKKIKEMGLDIDLEKSFSLLKKIVKETGSNYGKHYDLFLKELKNHPDILSNSEFNIPKYIAAGVWGYHSMKVRHLKLYNDVIKNLKKLIEHL